MIPLHTLRTELDMFAPHALVLLILRTEQLLFLDVRNVFGILLRTPLSNVFISRIT